MTVDNQRQWIVTSYMLGFGAAQGIGAAGTPVLAVSIVRDCYSRRKMSQMIAVVLRLPSGAGC
jgi:hypothetical protein